MNTVRVSSDSLGDGMRAAIAKARMGERIIVGLDDGPSAAVRFAIVPVEDAEYMERLENEMDDALADEALAEGDFIPWHDLRRELSEKHGL